MVLMFSGTKISVHQRQHPTIERFTRQCGHLRRMASPAVLTLPILDDRPGRTWSAQVPIRCGCCLVPILALRARSTVVAGRLGSLDECSQRGRERHAAPPRHVGVLTKSVKVINEIQVGLYV